MQLTIDDLLEIVPVEGDSLYIDSDRIEDCIIAAKKYGISNFTLNAHFGFRDKDLSVLKKFDFVTILMLQSEHLSDISAIYDLSDLKMLHCHTMGKSRIDLLRLPALEKIGTDSKYVSNLFNCVNLKYLGVELTGNDKSPDLRILHKLENLETLLIGSSLRTLEGIEYLHNLRELDIGYNRKLNDISQVKRVADKLEHLVFDSNKAISFFTPISSLKHLKKLLLNNCGDIPNLEFIRDLPALKFISFVDTNILDGDMTPLLNKNLSHVGFNNKKHYNLKCDYIVQYNKS
jgi:protein phosphatase 1 regulatory subunit 7